MSGFSSPPLLSNSAGIGYSTGAGGTVTQLTSKATGVTLNKICGQIVTHNAALGANTSVSFAFNNSFIAANDVLLICICGPATSASTKSYLLPPPQMFAGAAQIDIFNYSAGSLSEVITLNFVVIKSVAS